MKNQMKRMVTEKAKNLSTGYTEKISNKVSSILMEKTKDYFGFTIKLLNRPNYGMTNLYMWLMEKDKNFDKHIDSPIRTDPKNGIIWNSVCISNSEFLFKLEGCTYCYIQTGNKIQGYESLNERNSYSAYDAVIYIFGKKSYKYYKDLTLKINADKTDLKQFKVSGSRDSSTVQFTSIVSDLNLRDIGTLFFEDNTINKIISHIDGFFENEYIYTQRNLLYKTGVLLYGKPGTGKSSLVTAIATKYQCDVINIDMGTFSSLDISSLVDSINSDSNNYIVLLEDIDCIVDDRLSDTVDKEERKNLNKLLQFLDSNNSPSNVIFIATTNHPDKLDSALTREGRFDLKVQIGGIGERKATEMIKSFSLSDRDVNNVLQMSDCDFSNEDIYTIAADSNGEFVETKSKEKRINQSLLQHNILSYIKDTGLKIDKL